MTNTLLAGLLLLLGTGLAALPARASTASAEPSLVILDTDIGDDIDDAYALALLASSPDVRLLGVTAGFGQTSERAQIAAKLLHAMGRNDVPVFAGRRGGAKIGRQYEWARSFHSPSLKTEEAVQFLKREIDKRPGQITIIGIGPLVNIGDLLTRYPETAKKIRRVVIMGGSVYVGYNNAPPTNPEWNIKAAPDAAKALFTSGVPLEMAGLEVTTMMKLEPELQKRIYGYGTPVTDALAALTALWGGGVPTLYDAVAVAAAMGHNFSDSEQKHVVVTDDGMTTISEGAPNAVVLIHPQREAFLNWYVEALKPAAVSK